MPTYLFKNTKTEEVFEKWMKMSELDTYLRENPDIQKLPQFGYYGGVNDLKHKHIDDGFKEVLGNIRHGGLVGRNNNIDKWL